MKKLTISISLLIALLSLSMFAAIPNARAQPTEPTDLIADRIAEPQDLDPAWAYDAASAELLMNVYDTLLTTNRTNMDTFIPRLATSRYWDEIDEYSPEGIHWVLRLTFAIRNGVYFQSDGVNNIPGEGELLTPEDIEYTFERLLITDAATGPSRTIWEPLLSTNGSAGLNATLTDLGWPMSPTGSGWNTMFDEAVNHAIERNVTHVWFNLVKRYAPILQILSQSLGSIVNKAWCIWHGDWPGMQVGDDWYLWHDPPTSPLYSSDPAFPGPHTDCALGTGPYIFDYWNKGVLGSWSIIKNPNYWEGWTVPFRHEGWGAGEEAIAGHVDRYTSNYIPEWPTRRLRFLGGLTDFCDVPTYEVIVWPGIECIYPLPQLICNEYAFNFLVSDLSTHLGVMQPPGTFNQYGAPPDIMNDTYFRLAMTHMFNYTLYLQLAHLNESISPATPIIPGISYHDPSIQKPAYDMDLAVIYLQMAWGGAVWANGFTMDAVYLEGFLEGQVAATMIRDSFNSVNAIYDTKFTINVVSESWSAYLMDLNTRTMPLFIAGWRANFPDAHDFAYAFMHSEGPIPKYQSYHDAEVDLHVDSGMTPSWRQVHYTWLQQHYVDDPPGFVISQPTGRHWQRDWVEGWYYSPIYGMYYYPIFPGNYIYDVWKAALMKPVDVAVTYFSGANKLEVNFPVPDNTPIEPYPSPVSVTVARLDTNPEVPTVLVIIAVSLIGAGGSEIVLGFDAAQLAVGASYTAEFFDFVQDPSSPTYPGSYTILAKALIGSAFAYDTNLANNVLIQITPVTASILMGDINCDGTVDMADISAIIDAFMTSPGQPGWDIRCDLNQDESIDMADISIIIDAFMTSFDP